MDDNGYSVMMEFDAMIFHGYVVDRFLIYISGFDLYQQKSSNVGQADTMANSPKRTARAYCRDVH